MKIPNLASQKSFAPEFVNQLMSELLYLEGERAEREDRWQEYYDAWSATDQDPGSRRGYRGRANIQLPQLRKEIETMSRRLSKAMFPEDYLKAEPSLYSSNEEAITNTQVVRHFFDNIMTLRAKVHPWLKQNVIYGTSPLKVFWHKEENEILYRKRTFKTDSNGIIIPGFNIVKENVKVYNAPKVRTCDLFDTYVYPFNATTASEIERVYYKQKVTWQQLKDKEKAGVAVNLDQLRGEGKKIDHAFESAQERMQAFGESGTLLASDEGGEYFDLVEIWGKAELPGLGYVPYVCEIVNGSIPIRIQRNPLWHQSAPFVFARFILPPGNEFYGRGLPEASLPLQAQLNDTLNQTMDSVNLSLNNITIVNPAYAPNQESFEIEPGAVWWADPASVKQFTFPDLSEIGMKNAGLLRAMITELSDNSPQLPDPIAGKARSTGQAQLAVNEWQTDLYSFVNQIIDEAMNPLAKMVHSLLQQNLEDDEVLKISGKYAGEWVNKIVTPHDICGAYDFKWIGAIQVENQSVKTQQMLNFLKLVPMMPGGAERVNWDNLLIKLFRDGFNIRDVENIVKTQVLSMSTPSHLENKIQAMGGNIEVVPADDDDAHIMMHKELLTHKDPMVRFNMAKHIEAHNKQKEEKAKAAQMMQMQQQMLAMQNEMAGGKTAGMQGRPPNDMASKINNPVGNQGQLSETTDGADLERGLR